MMIRSFKLALSLSALATALGPGAALVCAWGGKGHQLQARAALRALPAEFPAFFRQAVEEMVYLISEPDRWRTREQPALTETEGASHGVKWEIVPHPLPANRYRYIIELTRQGKLDPPRAVRDYGTAAYAFQEWAEMLTAAFRRWRAMPDSNDAERARKRQFEQSILFMAGVAGHWATDVTNPTHASVHGSGWHSSVPNPNGYEGKGIHARFESQFVEAAIPLEDVTARVDDQPRLLGDWLREVEKVIAASNSHVEQIYIWDKQTPFGGGKEPKEAAAFTAARLADGARFLRDLWYTAWMRSGEPLP